MLRPERMSKISVTGSKAVMPSVIETVHDLNVLHVSDYDGSWEGFDNGSPAEGAEGASEKLVTVRSLESILDVSEEDAGPARIVDEHVDETLAAIREEVNDLDDRRAAIRDDLRSVEERIDAAEPFVELGIDLDLLDGYDSVEVAVGEGDRARVESALSGESEVRAFDVFGDGDVMAVVARPASNPGEDVLDDVLVGTEFAQLAVPEASGSPAAYVRELEHERQKLESRLESVESELDDARLEHGGFLLALEEELSIEVQKTEIPLQFATTEHAFVAEGWIPTDEVGAFEATLRSAVGDRIEFEELERAEYRYDDGHGHAEETEAVADGGVVTTIDDVPPTIQDNPGPVRPFEALVEVINRPKYGELDPTVVLFMTFPAFFGFMIGDLGYGILYAAIGYLLLTRFESDGIRSLGGVALWAGGFTALFGVLYGEFFGLHQLGEFVWDGNPPLHKGLQPHYLHYAQAWLLVSAIVGVLHLVTGWTFGFAQNLRSHGLKDAILEDGSWIMLAVGLWVWVFSLSAEGPKPDFIFTVFASGEGAALPIGFTGFSATVGMVGLVVAAVGFVLVLVNEIGHLGTMGGTIIGIIEGISQGLGHVLSYTRLAAVLLAKAGMALAVNLLVFGATFHDGQFHFIFFQGGTEHVLFGGLLNGGAVSAIFGIVVLVVGHLLVLALGLTSAGLQAVRLEYVEFFGKFYEGGGAKYNPFGYERTYTAED